MLKKLRRKFILINMLLVTAVLAVVFAAMCCSTYGGLADRANKSLAMALEQPDGFDLRPEIGKKPDGGQFDGNRDGFQPIFTVTVDRDQNIVSSRLENVTVSDEVLAQAVQAVLSGETSSGVLRELGLRYMLTPAQFDGGYKIAFLDRSSEESTMRTLIVSSLLLGAASLAALFVISVLFSGWAMRPVKEAWESQRQFVADASHELKTPLTVMLMNGSIISAHPEETVAQQKKWLDSSAEEGERMKKLIGDMLYLARSDSGRAAMVTSEFSLSDALWNRLLPFESAAYEKGIELASDVAPGITAKGDEEQLKQLMGILLDNAVKYAGEHGRVDVLLEKQGERAALTVKNTGEPIPAADLPHIFERFYRSDKSRSRADGGYGLGLAIAKTIADAHKIKLSVQSDAKNGTTFTAVFPQ